MWIVHVFYCRALFKAGNLESNMFVTAIKLISSLIEPTFILIQLLHDIS